MEADLSHVLSHVGVFYLKKLNKGISLHVEGFIFLHNQE